MITEFLSLLSNEIQFSTEERTLINSSFTCKTLTKGEFFLREGETCRHLGFIKKGLVRYFVLKDDEESTFEFTKEGEFIADYSSFNTQTKSIQNIEAIEDCELLIIDYSKLQFLFKNVKDGNHLGRLIVEHRFEIMVNQLLAVYMQNSEQRYQKFITEYGDLTQRIPQYLIASFVGVKPPSLSRIRKRMSQ